MMILKRIRLMVARAVFWLIAPEMYRRQHDSKDLDRRISEVSAETFKRLLAEHKARRS
jgi:hypothetical protein